MCKKHLRINRAMSLFAILFAISFQIVSVNSLSAQAVACNKDVQVSLDGITCDAVITPDMILEGSWPDYSLFTVDIEGVAGNVVSQKGDYTVTVTYTPTGNSCWGDIHVEDKIAPVITGTTSEVACAPFNFDTDFAPGTTVSLDFADPLCRDLASYFVPGPLPATGFVVLDYTVINFNIPVSGSYSFAPQALAGCNYVFNIYPQGEFDPLNPCSTDMLLGFGGLSTINGLSLTAGACLDQGNYELVICSLDPSCADMITRTCNPTCNDLEALLDGDMYTGQPLVSECHDYDCSYTDVTVGSSCGGLEVTRTWICIDECDNTSAPYNEVFTLDPVDINDVLAPDATVSTSCGVDSDPQSIYDYLVDNGYSEIKATTSAWPTYYGKPITDPTFCNLAATYSDQVIPSCGVGCSGNEKVFRTWTIYDWCDTSVTPVVFMQIIKASDDEAPTAIFNTSVFQYSVDPWGCAASFALPVPDILHDNCDSDITYTVHGPAGVLITGNNAVNVPVGSHTFTYDVSDCCGNINSVDITVNIVDQTPPNAVATQNIVVSLTYGGVDGGLAKLFNTSVDNGSHDGCTPVTLEIRRDTDNCGIPGNKTFNAGNHPNDGNNNPNSANYDTDNGEFVKFCCEDIYGSSGVDEDGDGINDYAIIKVWLRVWDDNGNYNETWTDVRVEDKLAPAIVCPADVVIDCDDDPTNLTLTGTASAYNACDNAQVTYTDANNINNCNYGFINRKWSVVGSSNVFCVQTIQILPGDPFDGDDIVWPSDMDTDCTDLGFTGIPTYSSGACDMVAYSMESDTFLFESGACLKILNRFQVVDWCQYDPNNPDQDNDGVDDGIWYHTQTIKVNDSEKPVMTCTDAMFEVNDHLDADNDGVICEARGVMLTQTAMDNGNCASDWLKWEVDIDLWGDGTVDYTYSSNLPSNNPFYLAPTSNGGEVKVTLTDIAGSMNNHTALWKVTDGCGNITSCTQNFMVVDKKAPSPYCVNISTALMENGTVDLWAIDFDLGATDNCTDQDDLRFTFSSVPPSSDPNYIPSLSSSSHTFDCDDIPGTPGDQIPLNVYVWDEKDNFAFCTVYLTLIDNNNSCGTGTLVAPIGGRVSTEDGQDIEDVNVELHTDGLIGFPLNQMTNITGNYAFYNNPMYLNYDIQGNKVDDYMNGVSTLDLVLMQKHMLGVQYLDSPYKVIASDINGDSNVSALDLIELRKLILGIYTELPSNDSWRFVDAVQTWSNNLSPFPFTEVLEVLPLNNPMMAEDFIGVKIGDVNNTAAVNFTENTSNRSNGAIELIVKDQTITAGEKVSVDFTAEDFDQVVGLQFTLTSNSMQLSSAKSGKMQIAESNYAVHTYNVAVSLDNINGVSAASNEVLFTLEFVAQRSGSLSEAISITDAIVSSEIYTNNGNDIADINLTFRNEGELVESGFELFQNEPNPFVNTTRIGFNLGTAGQATINIYDVTGKVLRTITRDFNKGYNQVEVAKSDLEMSGILYYQLESGAFSATKKMIIIE